MDSEVEVEFLKEELKHLDSLIEKYDGIIIQYRNECDEVSDAAAQREEQQKVASIEEQDVFVSCCGIGQEMNLARQEQLQYLQKIADMDSNNQLLSQTPLESYKSLLGTFTVQLERYIETQFKEPMTEHEQTSSHVCNDTNDSLHLIRGEGQFALEKRFYTLQKLDECLFLKSLEGILEQLQEQVLDTILGQAKDMENEFKTIDIECCESFLRSHPMEDEIVKLQTDLTDITEKLDFAIRCHSKYKILTLVMASECHMKECRQQYWIKQFNCLLKHIQSWLSFSDIFCQIVRDQWMEMRDMMDIITNCHLHMGEEYECFTARMMAMQKAKDKFLSYQGNSLGLHPRIEQCLQYLLSTGCKPNDTSSSLEEAIQTMNEDIAKMEKHLFVGNLHEQKEILLQNEENIKQLHGLVILESPENTYSFSSDIKELKLLIDELEQSLELIVTKKANKQSQFEEKPFIRKLRMLWIYFLMEPNKLCSAVQDIDEAYKIKFPISVDSLNDTDAEFDDVCKSLLPDS